MFFRSSSIESKKIIESSRSNHRFFLGRSIESRISHRSNDVFSILVRRVEEKHRTIDFFSIASIFSRLRSFDRISNFPSIERGFCFFDLRPSNHRSNHRFFLDSSIESSIFSRSFDRIIDFFSIVRSNLDVRSNDDFLIFIHRIDKDHQIIEPAPRPPCATLHYPALPCTTLHYPALLCTTLHYSALPCTTLLSPTLPCKAMHYPALPCVTLQYPTLP